MKRFWQSALAQSVWRFAGAVSIQVKVMGIVIGVILLLGTFVILQMRDVLESTLAHELQQQGTALATSITQEAGAYIIRDELDELRERLAEQKDHYSSPAHNTQVSYITIENNAQEMLLSIGDDVTDIPMSLSDHNHGSDYTIFVTNDNQLFEIQSSIPEIDGLLRLGLSKAGIMATVHDVSFQLFAITLVMVAVGFAAAFFLTWILTRPVVDLVEATHAVARGDFSQRVSIWAKDEIGELAVAYNHMTQSLAKAEQERADRERLREQYINGVILAQENERQRIARELHDSTSQSLTSLLVGLQNIRSVKNEKETEQQIEDLRTIITSTLDEIRNISWQLRPGALDDMGFISAVENYVQNYENRYQIPVDIVATGFSDRLEPEVETSIYRIIQEGLTNIVRYASATSVSLILQLKDSKLKIVIEDDGIGFDPAIVQKHSKSLGLQGIRERASLLGGTLIIESQPGQGTSLFIEIPCVSQMKEANHDR